MAGLVGSLLKWVFFSSTAKYRIGSLLERRGSDGCRSSRAFALPAVVNIFEGHNF